MNDFKFNEYFSTIFTRTPWDDTVRSGDWIAVGCSHTAGYGVNPNEIYINLLSQHYQLPIHNLAFGMGNHVIARRNTQLWFNQVGKPGLVIAQWPNPIRRTTWTGDTGILVSVSQPDKILHTMLQCGEENFLADWLDSIITLNQFCRAFDVPVVNILLETMQQQWQDILYQHNIVVHDDKKLPEQSWIFDSGGNDRLHHSAKCHQQWAERLAKIINEHTPR
jgi:hypothetical protein